MPVTIETVRKMALALDKVEEGTSYGTAKQRGTGVGNPSLTPIANPH